MKREELIKLVQEARKGTTVTSKTMGRSYFLFDIDSESLVVDKFLASHPEPSEPQEKDPEADIPKHPTSYRDFTMTEQEKPQTAEDLKEQIACKHGIINGFTVHSNPTLARRSLYNAMEEYATQKHIPTDELQEFMNDVHKWADDTFGKERTAKAPLYHLKKEVDEAVKAMEQGIRENTLTELADCFILILNASSKYRMTFKELLEASKEKMIINKSRKWGKPDRNGVVEHDRSETEPAKELTEPGFVRSGDAPHEIIWQGVEYVKKSEDYTCDSCGCHPSVIIVTTKGRFCQDYVRY